MSRDASSSEGSSPDVARRPSRLRRYTGGVVRHVVRAVAYGLVGAVIMLVIVFVLLLESRQDLSAWHEVRLDEEFTASSDASTLSQYLEFETRVFDQLQSEVIDEIGPSEQGMLSRFTSGSYSDPERWSRNWNRTFEMASDEPVAGVLFLHGLSDSPYSLRHLALAAHDAGAWVVGLRLPGHGTAPSGLVHLHWQDMAAAVRLAVAHLREKVGDRPIAIVGYSIGGALAVNYSIEMLEDDELPRVSRLVLVSPAIGVTRLASLAVWQARLGRVTGLGKLAWNALLPEYDPYKYGSFAVNAGDLTYRLTAHIQSRLASLAESGELDEFPPVLAFQSVVDATVSPQALVDGLFMRLPDGGHELVLFDINRFEEIGELLRSDPGLALRRLLQQPDRAFTMTLLTNESESSRRLSIESSGPGERAPVRTGTTMEWPNGLYSLAHVALPFPVDDPLYGVDPRASAITPLQLGDLALRGERGVLEVSAADMLRLRSNPFYPYLEERALAFLGLGTPASSEGVESTE